MSISVQKINPPTLPDAPAMGYSQISVCEPGKLVFISGQVAWQPDASSVPEDLQTQTEIAMSNVSHALDAVGATVENITAMRMYVVNPTEEDFGVVGAALRPFFGDVIPTLTALGVASLYTQHLKIELEVTAVIS
jgi:enamine deaminase RidA (YjgF/YER057c/UK114 family)